MQLMSMVRKWLLALRLTAMKARMGVLEAA